MSGHPEADIYHRQGMGNRAGLGEKPALVIVDFVVGFSDPAHFGGGNIAPAIAQTVKLLAFARRHGWPVAHTRVVYADDGSDAGVFTLKAPSLRKLTEASPLSQIVPELAPIAGRIRAAQARRLGLFRHRPGRLACLPPGGHGGGGGVHHLGLRARHGGRFDAARVPHRVRDRLRRRPRHRPA